MRSATPNLAAICSVVAAREWRDIPDWVPRRAAATQLRHDAERDIPQILVRLPVAPRRKRIALLPIISVVYRVPRPTLQTLDQFECDAVSLDRQRMVGVLSIGAVDILEVAHPSAVVGGAARCLRQDARIGSRARSHRDSRRDVNGEVGRRRAVALGVAVDLTPNGLVSRMPVSRCPVRDCASMAWPVRQPSMAAPTASAILRPRSFVGC